MVMAKKKPAKKNPWPALLTELRERLDLTQAEAAARCRISQSQWSVYEAGKRRPTRPIAYLIELLDAGKI